MCVLLQYTEESGSNGPEQEPVVFTPPSEGTTPQRPRVLPAYAKVVTPRIPNAYDKTALKLEVSLVLNKLAILYF